MTALSLSFKKHGIKGKEAARNMMDRRRHTLPGVLLKRLHPHSLKSRRVQVEPADSIQRADSRGTRTKLSEAAALGNPATSFAPANRHAACKRAARHGYSLNLLIPGIAQVGGTQIGSQLAPFAKV